MGSATLRTPALFRCVCVCFFSERRFLSFFSTASALKFIDAVVGELPASVKSRSDTDNTICKRQSEHWPGGVEKPHRFTHASGPNDPPFSGVVCMCVCVCVLQKSKRIVAGGVVLAVCSVSPPSRDNAKAYLLRFWFVIFLCISPSSFYLCAYACLCMCLCVVLESCKQITNKCGQYVLPPSVCVVHAPWCATV